MENREILQAKSFINNEWIGHSTTNILVVKNKFDQSSLAHVSYADPSEVQFAISNSVQAFQSYSNTSAEERRDYLLKIRDGLLLEKEIFISGINKICDCDNMILFLEKFCGIKLHWYQKAHLKLMWKLNKLGVIK